MPERLARLPSSELLFLHFRFWHLWNPIKAQLFLGYKPKYDWAASQKKALKYYNAVSLASCKTDSILPAAK